MLDHEPLQEEKIMEIDYDEYLPMCDELNMTLEQKRLFLTELHKFIECFVDFGFGTDPTNLANPELAEFVSQLARKK